MEKDIITLNESQVKRTVTEGILEVLKEIQIPTTTNLFYDKGALTFIIDEIKLFLEYDEKREKMIAEREKYFNVNQQKLQTDPVAQHYWSQYADLSTKISNTLNQLWDEVIEPVDSEIEKDVNDWGKRRNPDDSSFRGFYYNSRYSGQ